jgi:hypothetical protein
VDSKRTGISQMTWVAVVGGVLVVVLVIAVVARSLHSTSSSGRHAVSSVKEDAPTATTSRREQQRSEQRRGVAAPAGSSAASWAAKFRSSNDYLTFVAEALPAARAGDGRANWYIAEALSSCSLVMKTYRDSPDPESQLNQELTNMPKAPQWARDLLEQKTHRCLGLAQQDPFASLPHRAEGYPSSYWRKQAAADGDSLAQVGAAADEISASTSPNMSEDERTDLLRTAKSQLRSAVESGDPDALYDAAVLVADPRYSKDPLKATAVALAACDLGRDCSASNPENPFYNCKLSGACPPDAGYDYYLQQSLGPDKYAQVYASAQQVKEAVEAGDWDAVMTNLTLDAHH